jgi:hypothetical protein
MAMELIEWVKGNGKESAKEMKMTSATGRRKQAKK